MNCFSSWSKVEDLSSLTKDEKRLTTFKKQFPHIQFTELQVHNYDTSYEITTDKNKI